MIVGFSVLKVTKQLLIGNKFNDMQKISRKNEG